ncbi:hypothetical protein P5F21_13550 [Clostridium perfringens]|nr:hypothetical protein [Clostridium perfringens]
MKVLLNNPAGKLYDYIVQIKENFEIERDTLAVFSNVFGSTSQNEAFENIIYMISLCNKSIDCIQNSNSNLKEKYTSIMNSVKEGISSISFNSYFNQYNKLCYGLTNFYIFFDDLKLSCLENCSDFLSDNFAFSYLEKLNVSEIISYIDETLNLISSSDLEYKYKMYIFNLISQIKISLTQYENNIDIDEIQDNLNTILGSILYQNIKTNQKHSSTFEKVFVLLNKVSTVLGILSSTQNLLTGNVANYLLNK